MTKKFNPTSGGRWSFMKVQDIMCWDENEMDVLYLRRHRLIQTPWFALFLHHIHQPDHDPDPHDHPFNFWSLVVRGGYDEVLHTERREGALRPAVKKTHGWLSFHKMSKQDAHRIISIKPDTWTLVFVGKRTKSWGYWTEDGFINFKDYLAANHPINLRDYKGDPE